MKYTEVYSLLYKIAQETSNALNQDLRNTLGFDPMSLRQSNSNDQSRLNFRGLDQLDEIGIQQQDTEESMPRYTAPTGPVEYETGESNGKKYFVANNDADTSIQDQKRTALNPVNPTRRRNIANSPYVKTVTTSK